MVQFVILFYTFILWSIDYSLSAFLFHCFWNQFLLNAESFYALTNLCIQQGKETFCACASLKFVPIFVFFRWILNKNFIRRIRIHPLRYIKYILISLEFWFRLHVLLSIFECDFQPDTTPKLKRNIDFFAYLIATFAKKADHWFFWMWFSLIFICQMNEEEKKITKPDRIRNAIVKYWTSMGIEHWTNDKIKWKDYIKLLINYRNNVLIASTWIWPYTIKAHACRTRHSVRGEMIASHTHSLSVSWSHFCSHSNKTLT